MRFENLAVLRDKLVAAKEFIDVYTYFLDEFCGVPEFMEAGESVDDPFLNSVIMAVGQQVFGPRAAPVGVALTRIAEHSFVHGAFRMNGSIASVFYFEDALTGLLCISSPSGDNHFARFSGRPVYRRPEPSMN